MDNVFWSGVNVLLLPRFIVFSQFMKIEETTLPSQRLPPAPLRRIRLIIHLTSTHSSKAQSQFLKSCSCCSYLIQPLSFLLFFQLMRSGSGRSQGFFYLQLDVFEHFWVLDGWSDLQRGKKTQHKSHLKTKLMPQKPAVCVSTETLKVYLWAVLLSWVCHPLADQQKPESVTIKGWNPKWALSLFFFNECRTD